MSSWGRGRGGRGRGRGRGGARVPQISSPAPPLGEIIVTIRQNEIESPADEDNDTSRITNSQYLTSYNWLAGEKSRIIVPGEPPKWTPLPDAPMLQKDRGEYYRDRNAAQYPAHPLEPMVQAILTDNPDFPVTNVDIIGCSSTMGNLLRFALGQNKSFRILVEVLGQTVFFVRRENSPTEKIPDVRGYGHTFPEAYTTWSARVGGSKSHQRVMQYEFAGMQCLVRFEPDGFLPDLVPDTEETEEDPVSPKDSIDPEGALASLEEATISDDISIITEVSSKQLETTKQGRRVPQCAIFDLKTRSQNRKDLNVLEEELPRFWVSQTQNFILALHGSGRFRDIRVQDVGDEVKQWEEAQQAGLGKFASLLQMIVAFARSVENGKLEIEREDGDYCDVYLTHDSMSVRKAHNSGRNHLRNVVDYYQQIGQEKAQSVIDSITSSYAAEGQQAPNMMPPGAFPPPFGFPGHPGMAGMPPPPFGIPPPGAPGAPGMLPPPGAHGLPFPPPFPNAAGTPPTGGFPPPLNMPQGANLPIPPPGGFPNFPIPPPGAGFPPMPMHGQPGAGPGGPSPIPTGPRGLEGYPPPPGSGNNGRMEQQW
ncbi:hypothetical protein PENVUL_c008G05434 [Penicillium vulpinum]|uniref:U1 small nuclear ribonucleoprotein C n=1 Tax=Penicillium vulpinum TaxID=29845 RepID=A0A1V6S516_9EURO|nr:hypothetical protein PENVUL_c008G05434 [Penicillium vulpinum]